MAFTREQENAIRANAPLVSVSAGAGSGKTTILIERIVWLLNTPECWLPGETPGLDRIAAITFTDKAAAEMKARLRRKFRDAPPMDDPQKMHFWREMERQVDSARVSTIHAFCSSILREHALRGGLDPEWSVLGEAESAQLTDIAIIQTLNDLLEQEDPAVMRLSLDMSRKQLKDALLTGIGMFGLQMATREEERYLSPENLYKYWQKALSGAVTNWLHTLRHSPAVIALLNQLASFEGQCEDVADKRELQRRAAMAVLESIRTGGADLESAILGYLGEFKRMAGSKKQWSGDSYERVKDSLGEVKKFLTETCLLPDWEETFEKKAAQITCDFYHLILQAGESCKQARKGREALDYEDMINETLRLLRSDRIVCERVARSIRFLLIDEFQDTDERQFEIARLLAEAPGGPNLFVVGDVKQSIYYFRGAEVALFSKVVKNSPQPLLLGDNFRSLPDVLHFINDFFEHTHLLDAVEAYRGMGVYRDPRQNSCVEVYIPESTDVKETSDLFRERDAQFIAGRIQELCHGNSALKIEDVRTGQMRQARYDDIVLLFRRGSYMETYESELRRKGIPYNRIAGAGFFQRREIQDVVALLKLILDPWDEEALVTVLRSPFAGLSDESLMRMALMPGGLASTFHSDVIPENFEQTSELCTFRCLMAFLYENRDMEPLRLLRCILEKTGYEAILLSQYMGLQWAANLRKVLQMADNFSGSRPATLSEFTQYLDDVTFRELREGESTLQSEGMGAVTLMTIHKAKGLEFPIVFLPEMFAGRGRSSADIVLNHKLYGLTAKVANGAGEFQTGVFSELARRQKMLEEQLESARVLYVAMTRAREYLVLSSHSNPDRYTWADTLNKVYDLPSRSHGDFVEGVGWRMRVTRELPKGLPGSRKAPVCLNLESDAITRKVAPLSLDGVRRPVLSVSQVLSLMTGEAFVDEEAGERSASISADLPEEGLNRYLAMARGTLVHRIFETWDFSSGILPDYNRLVDEAMLGIEQTEKARGTLESIVQRFIGSSVYDVIINGEVLEREVSFLLDLGPALLRGVVDAVVDNDVIIDYKTGRPHAETEHRYDLQLCLYAAAVYKIRGQMPARGYLWYADCGMVHEIVFTETLLTDIYEQAIAACNCKTIGN